MLKNNNNVLLVDLEDYMFTSKNMNRYTKHMIQNVLEPKESTKNIKQINSEKKCEKKCEKN